MKKLLALLLCFVMTLSFAACGGGTSAPNTSATPETEPTEPEPTLYAGFYYATLPDGFELDEESAKYETLWVREADPDNQSIEFQVTSSFDKSPEEDLTRLTEISNPYTLGESFEAGNYTWAYAYYDGSLSYSVFYCTKTPDGELLKIETENMEEKSDEVLALLESISVTDKTYDDHVAFYNAARDSK